MPRNLKEIMRSWTRLLVTCGFLISECFLVDSALNFNNSVRNWKKRHLCTPKFAISTYLQAKAALFLIPILGTYFVLLPMRPAVGTRLGTDTCAARRQCDVFCKIKILSSTKWCLFIVMNVLHLPSVRVSACTLHSPALFCIVMHCNALSPFCTTAP